MNVFCPKIDFQKIFPELPRVRGNRPGRFKATYTNLKIVFFSQDLCHQIEENHIFNCSYVIPEIPQRFLRFSPQKPLKTSRNYPHYPILSNLPACFQYFFRFSTSLHAFSAFFSNVIIFDYEYLASTY